MERGIVNRDFVAGVLIGVVIALLWRALQPQPTPPDRNDKIVKVPNGYWDVEIAS